MSSDEPHVSRIIGTPNQIVQRVTEYFEVQRIYVRETAPERWLEEFMDAMEREVWQVEIRPLGKRVPKSDGGGE